MDTFKVYAAIAAVMADVSKEGISKDRRNQAQGYNFRGIDEVYNALSPILAKHKLCILPRVLSREVVERQTQKGGVLFTVTVEVEFDFISAEDGSKHTIKTYGEAMDSADKATNKAMSAAYKYAAMQAFCIPTEGDNDADAETHVVAPGKTAAKKAAPGAVTSTPFDERDDSKARAYIEGCLAIIATGRDEGELRQWWADQRVKRVECQISKVEIDIMLGKLKARIDELNDVFPGDMPSQQPIMAAG